MDDAERRIWVRGENGIARLELEIDAEPRAVWTALREPAELRRWFGWDYDGIEREIEQIFLDDVGEDAGSRILDLPGGDRFGVVDSGAGTRLVIIRGEASEDPVPDAERYDAIGEGWTAFVEQLRFALERHPGEERRATYIAGPGREGFAGPMAALGLVLPDGLAPGERFDVDACPGRIAGELRFRSAHTLGISVDALGDGLAVLARTPASDERPAGSGAVTLTSYGLDPREASEIEGRWRACLGSVLDLGET